MKYQVKEGDSLSTIAHEFYGHGDEAHWKKIWEANQHVSGVGGPPDYALMPHHDHATQKDVFPEIDIPE